MRMLPALIVIIGIVIVPALAQQPPEIDNILIGDMTKAVEQGNPGAALQLGLIYAYGSNGILKDNVQAYMWLDVWRGRISDQLETTRAEFRSVFLDKIAREMTPAQIAEARRLASEWQSKHSQSRPAGAAVPQSTPVFILLQPLPPYTEAAQQAGVEGVVTLEYTIRKDGTIDSFKVIRTLGYGMTESAINTILSKWKYVPATVNGLPVDTRTNIEIPFRLSKENK